MRKKKSSGLKNTTDTTDTDDAPELTTTWFAEADLKEGDRVIKRGRGGTPSEKSIVKQ